MKVNIINYTKNLIATRFARFLKFLCIYGFEVSLMILTLFILFENFCLPQMEQFLFKVNYSFVFRHITNEDIAQFPEKWDQFDHNIAIFLLAIQIVFAILSCFCIMKFLHLSRMKKIVYSIPFISILSWGIWVFYLIGVAFYSLWVV